MPRRTASRHAAPGSWPQFVKEERCRWSAGHFEDAAEPLVSRADRHHVIPKRPQQRLGKPIEDDAQWRRRAELGSQRHVRRMQLPPHALAIVAVDAAADRRHSLCDSFVRKQ